MSTCDRHPDVKQSARGCGQCGAPQCCPACCDEATAENEAHCRDDDTRKHLHAHGRPSDAGAFDLVCAERDSLATQLEQMRRERDEARADLDDARMEVEAHYERTREARDLAVDLAAQLEEALAKLARVREAIEARHLISRTADDTCRTVLRIIDEKEGGQ